jgi:hypothetical protein
MVFGFCLGGGTLQEAYKTKRINELRDQQLTPYHDEFAKNYETKPPPTGFTHFFPRGFRAQKFPSYQECGGTEGQVSALRRLTLAPKKEAPREKNSRGAHSTRGTREGASYRRLARATIASWISM